MNSNKFIYPKDMLKLGRSSWDMSTRVKTSLMHGDAVPILWMEVLPGDEIALDVAELIRMSTPIAPIMDDIIFHMAAYFEPMRLVFENWEELCGANKDGAWTVGLEDVVVPLTEIVEGGLSPANDNDCQGCFTTHNYGDSLAPYKYHTLADFITGCHKWNTGLKLSLLPWRVYYDIWNNNYRSQVVSAPIAVDKSANNGIIVDEQCYKTIFRKCEPLGKLADLFTKMLPEPQKGDAVKFLSDLVPVVGIVENAGTISDSAVTNIVSSGGIYDVGDLVNIGVGASPSALSGSDLYADLTKSINTINDLRYAFQLQKFLEKDARFGTRYFEYLNAHFGITIAEGVVQLPQWLGETNFRINVDQVLSTAGYAPSSSTSVGAPGANSVTGKKDKLFRFTAKEHGYIMIICGCRHNHTYSAGLNKQLFHKSKLDFYHPEFANIGEVAVLQEEMNAYTDGLEGDAIGYQEAWYEYRYLPSKTVGLLNPLNTGALKFWTLADRPVTYYQLNENFIYEGREAISDALVTGATGPDYIGDFLFKFRMTRVMPAYSIPGFADHH